MGSSKKQTVGYRYYLGLHMGLCHGPVDALLEIRGGDRTAWSGNQTTSGTITINAPDLFGGDDREGGIAGALDVMMGEPTQAANAYLQAQQGAPQPAYRGILGLVFRGPSSSASVPPPPGIGGLGSYINLITGRPSGLVASNNPYIKPWAFRIRRILQGWTGGAWYAAKASIDLGGGVIAMNPAHIAYECLTNAQWGLGYPSGQIDLPSFTAAADTFHAEGLGLCMMWAQQDSIQNFLQTVMDHAGAVLAQDQVTGLFKIRAIRGDYVLASLPSFGLQAGNVVDVQRIERATYTEAVNEITVAYTDAATGKDGSVTVQQLAAIQGQGAVVPETRQYPGLPTAELALRTAMRDLTAATSGLARVTMTVNRSAYSLIPGDVIRFDWEPAGIASMALRVGSIDYGSMTDGTMTLECVEDVFSLPATSYIGNQSSLWIAPNYTPQASAQVQAFEAPYRELVQVLGRDDAQAVTSAQGYAAFSAIRPPGFSSSYALETRTATTSYAETAQGDWCPSTTLSAGATPGQTVLNISSTGELGLVAPGSLAMIGTGATAELVRVDSANAGAGTITVGRGCVDTVPRAWTTGTRVMFLDEFSATDGRDYAAGEVVTGRFRTRAGSGILADTASPTASITIAGRAARPYPPGNFRLNGTAYPASISGALTVSWSHRDRLLQDDQLIDTAAANVGPEAGTTYTLRLYDQTGTLRRTETGLTGTSYTWATEAADSGISGAPINERIPSAWSQSSAYAAGLTATVANMRDGDGTTGAATNNGALEWVEADLGSALSVASVLVGGGLLPTWGSAAAYLNGRTLQHSNDRTTWTTVATISGVVDGNPPVQINFAAVSARYWRISHAGWMAVSEFRMFQSAGAPALNTQVRAELWAVRGGIESFQRHDLTVPRV